MPGKAGFYQPPHFPNCYITTIVAGAFVHAHRVLGDAEYLRTARSAAEFLLHDLPALHHDADTMCLAYVPDLRAQFRVINVNALAAAVLAEVGTLTDEPALLDRARLLLNFVAREQTPYGAWHYTVNPRQSLVSHDNYHTGMILDALLTYAQATGDDRFQPAYRAGLDYYRTQLFLPDGAPKWTNERCWPHDVHGSAKGR